MIEHSRLLELIDYDPITGVFIRKVATSNRIKIGDVATTNGKDGYLNVNIDGNRYEAGRLAWFYFYGKWPNGLIDHRNLNKRFNAINNLRETNYSGNGANRDKNKNNSSGFKGVSPHGKGFTAKIRFERKLIYLGFFQEPIEAAKAYDEAALKYFGVQALTNKTLGYL